MSELSAIEQEIHEQVKQQAQRESSDLIVSLKDALRFVHVIPIRGCNHDSSAVLSGIQTAIVDDRADTLYKLAIKKLVKGIMKDA